MDYSQLAPAIPVPRGTPSPPHPVFVFSGLRRVAVASYWI